MKLAASHRRLLRKLIANNGSSIGASLDRYERSNASKMQGMDLVRWERPAGRVKVAHTLDDWWLVITEKGRDVMKEFAA